MYSIYNVQNGDTLESIALKTNSTKNELMSINGMNSEFVSQGMILVVPMNTNYPFTNYIVKKGDSIYEIARKYNVDYKTLLEINGLKDNEYIYPNQEIIIPNPGYKIYVTKMNDTLSNVANYLNTDQTSLIKDNMTLYLMPEQLIISKN